MNFFLHVVILACVTVPTALGFNVVLGKGKILFFGQEALSLVGAYVIWVLVMQYQFPFIVGVIATFMFTAIFALLFAWLSLRLEADALGVMSIAVHLAILAVVLNWQSVTRGALGIPRIPRAPWPESIEGFALVAVIVAGAWFAIVHWFSRGKYGRALAALSEHMWHAQSLGISRPKIYAMAYLIAGIGSAIAGVLYPPYIHLLTPMDYSFPFLVFLVMVVVAGVPGSVKGCVISLFLLSFLKEGIRLFAIPATLLGPVRLLLFGLILFVAVWYRRDSLFPKQRSI